MFKRVVDNPLLRFLVIGSALYVSWYVFYEFYLHSHTNFDRIVINSLVELSEKTLRLIGYSTTNYAAVDAEFHEHIGIDGYKGLTIGAPCDGVILYALFIIFIVAFPGPIKHKLWYVPIGAFSVFYVNVLRIVALAIIMSINEEWLAFNHDYTFTILVYAYVFALWMIWVKRFSPFSQHSSKS
jgi:exosortase family protein XrtF